MISKEVFTLFTIPLSSLRLQSERRKRRGGSEEVAACERGTVTCKFQMAARQGRGRLDASSLYGDEALELLDSFSSDKVSEIARSTSSLRQNPNRRGEMRLELARRFSTYRSGPTSRPSSGAGSLGLRPQNHSASPTPTAFTHGRLCGRQSARRKKKSSAQADAGGSKRGRPSLSQIVYKDLVIIPDPNTTKVPTYESRITLERKRMVISGFPFDRAWDAVKLRSPICSQLLDREMIFEYMKVRLTTVVFILT